MINSYITQYLVFGTVHGALHLTYSIKHHLGFPEKYSAIAANLSSRTTLPPLSTIKPRYSFIQQSELEQSRIEELAQDST